MTANGSPTLVTVPGAVLQEVTDCWTSLSPSTKAGNRRIPDGLARTQCPHLPQPDLPHGCATN
jgi:hypothetical protein